MSRFRRFVARLKGKKKEEAVPEQPTPEAAAPAEEPVKIDTAVSPSEHTPAISKPLEEPVQRAAGPVLGVPTKPERDTRISAPDGTLVAPSAQLRIDARATENIARSVKIEPQRVAEIVPGKALKRDEAGRIHIKIVFYGPSLSGKTTALRWLFANVRSLSKGRIVEISDDLGRTTYFDFIPVSASENIVFDIFTVAGQRRHATQRISVLREVDGLIFMADSIPEQMNENLASMQELRIALGTDRMATIPLIVSLNKRDLPNALPVDYMLQMLDLEGYPVFPTIATEGKNLLRMFQRILRDSTIFKVGI